MGSDEILTILVKSSSLPNIMAIGDNTNDPASRFELVSVSDEYAYWLLKCMDIKSLLGLIISLVNFLKLVFFQWLDPSLISLIWAPTNTSSRIIWNLLSNRRYIREETTYKNKMIWLCVFCLPCQIFSNARCQIKWQHIWKICFRNSCRHSDTDVDANPH